MFWPYFRKNIVFGDAVIDLRNRRKVLRHICGHSNLKFIIHLNVITKVMSKMRGRSNFNSFPKNLKFFEQGYSITKIIMFLNVRDY